MFYIYSIKSLETGKVYIGSRTSKVMLNRKHEEDLGVKYFSSSKDKELRRAINDGKVSYKVIKEYSDAKECVRDENEMIRLFWLFFGKENSYNHCYSKCNGEKVWSTAGLEPAIKGKHLTKETKKKLSESKKGKHLTKEHKKKIGESRKGEKHPLYGKHHTEETLKKQREAKKEYYKTHDSAFKGKHFSEEAKEKIRKTRIEYYKTHDVWNKGKHHTEETLKKLRRPKPKFKYQIPSGEIKIMERGNAKRWHKDWIEIGPVE